MCRALRHNQVRAAANGIAFSAYNLDKLFANRFVGWLPNEELVGVVGLGALSAAVQSGLTISIQREAAETLSGFLGIFFSKESLISVIAFEGNAEKNFAVVIRHLAQIINLVGAPRFK